MQTWLKYLLPKDLDLALKIRDFYFLWQWVTTWQFKLIMNQFIAQTFGVHLCCVIGVVSTDWPAGPELEYCKDFFHE